MKTSKMNVKDRRAIAAKLQDIYHYALRNVPESERVAGTEGDESAFCGGGVNGALRCYNDLYDAVSNLDLPEFTSFCMRSNPDEWDGVVEYSKLCLVACLDCAARLGIDARSGEIIM